MTLDKILETVNGPTYDFLTTDPHLGKNIILLGLGGSHAYGTATETSDLDVRGITLNKKEEILGSANFEQFENHETDTTIYAFNKMMKLLAGSNPNVIELLGLRPEHYLAISDVGMELLQNKDMFLSQKAIHTFGSYASSQLRRLDNKAVRTVQQEAREQHILNSILGAKDTFPEKYFQYPEDAIRLYIDTAVQEGYDTEIFMDVTLRHYPLRDYKAMWSEMNNIVKDYSKIGKRNRYAIEASRLGKHMMHLVRLYYMCFDILLKGEINTYREDEHDLLMSIRNGDFLDENDQPVPEFYKMVDELEKKLEYCKTHTKLPERPDYNRINEFVMSVNERVVRGEIG